MKFTTRRAVCSSSAPCKYEKICVNFHGLVQEQRCVVCFETCAVIWKIYLAELLLPSYSFSGFSGSFTEMRRKDIRLKKRSFICQSTSFFFLLPLVATVCSHTGSTRINTFPLCTTSPLFATNSTTRPVTSDWISLKTFMASINATTCPACTTSPGRTNGGEVGDGPT